MLFKAKPKQKVPESGQKINRLYAGYYDTFEVQASVPSGKAPEPAFFCLKPMEKSGIAEWEFSLQELEEICGEVYSRFSGYRVWLLEGMLGSGKTTFVQHLLRHLVSEDQSN